MWVFTFEDTANQEVYAEPHADWQTAFEALTSFIDSIRPPVSYASLKTVCENIPIGHSTSFSDGAFVFSLAPQ